MSGKPGSFESWVCSLKKVIYELVFSLMLTESISGDGIGVVDTSIVIVIQHQV